MDKESYYGFVEYKRYIKITNPLKHNSLVSQLKYRLIEGNGQCVYMIGVEDNGTIYNMSDEDYEESNENLKKMCISANAEIISTKKITQGDKYYYKIIINDVITENEYRVLNIINAEVDNLSIDIIGIDKNNNILTLDDTNSYDLKKHSNHLIYINNISKIEISKMDILKNIINYKPHIINYMNYNNSCLDNKYNKLFNELDIPIVYYNELSKNIFEIIKLKKESYQMNIGSKNILTIFQTLYKGNILNWTKIYACITNNKIYDEDKDIFVYNLNLGKKEKLIIDSIYHIYQPVIKINSDKLISISTLNTLTTSDIHICYNDCNCFENETVLYTDTIINKLNDVQIKSLDNITKKYYPGYYKNEVFKVKFIADKIILNKKVVLDENILIIDIESEFLFINI
jgi:hypothetical protein